MHRQLVRSFGILLMLLMMGSTVRAQDDPLQIVASHSILADVVQQVAGDAAEVSSLLPRDADPHTYTPSPRELVSLAEADVVFVNGANFEEGLSEAIENAAEEINIVAASECVQILPIGQAAEDMGESHIAGPCEVHYAEAGITPVDDALGLLIDLDCEGDHDHDEDEDGDHDHDEDEEGDHDHEDEEGDHDHAEDEDGDHDHAEDEDGDHDHDEDEDGDHDHAEDEDGDHDHEDEDGDHNHEDEEHHHEAGSCDPHVWMNPQNVMLWALTIRDALTELDPANAEIYAQNAAAYIATLSELDSEIGAKVDAIPPENRVLVTNHDSLGYFAAHYEFRVVGVVIPGGSTLAEPSAQDVVALIETISEQRAPAVFAETTINPDLAQQIADESGAALYTLYSGSLSDDDGPASTYVDYMRFNAETIVDGLD